MIIMQNMLKKLDKYQIKAFTLLESLLTLSVTCFILMTLTGGITSVYHKVSETLFLLNFENLYRDTQQLSVISRKDLVLTVDSFSISNHVTQLAVPNTISVEPQTIVFNKNGGNSSLSKISFKLSDRKVSYQLYLGNGNFKKKEN